jgi:peptide/nickel transport system permease protein
MLIFVLMRLVPGDIAEILVYQAGSETSGVQQKQIQKIRAELGLNQPVMVQYLSWMGGAVRGDFGKSYAQRRPVWDILRERFPRSMELAILTLAIAVIWAIPLGVVSAVHQNGPLDYLARIASLSGLSIPLFVTGALILYGLVRVFHWIPPLEFVAFTENPVENLKQLIWPALAQAYYISAPITRLTRSQMLEVIRQDYVRTARAKGLPERLVVDKHALANAMIPVVTVIGLIVGILLGGAVVVEQVFSLPGAGRLIIGAILRRDYPVIQGGLLLTAVIFVFVNLAVDVLYASLDPRVRYD